MLYDAMQHCLNRYECRLEVSLNLVCATHFSLNPMNITLKDIKIVECDGIKHQIKISGDDIVDCGGETFIRLRPNNSSLVAFVLENNEIASDIECRSLTHSNGLLNLMQMRNEAQASDLKPNGCSLFEGSVETDQKKRKRVHKSLQDMKKEREIKRTLNIDLEVNGDTHAIPVLRPVHGRDGLYVKYEAACLGVALQYIRDEGFREQKHKYKSEHGDIPSEVLGIFKRVDYWLVHYFQGEQPKYKKFVCLDDAKNFQMTLGPKNVMLVGEADVPAVNEAIESGDEADEPAVNEAIKAVDEA